MKGPARQAGRSAVHLDPAGAGHYGPPLPAELLGVIHEQQPEVDFIGDSYWRRLSLLAGVILVTHRRNFMEEFSQFLERRHAHAKHHPPEL